MTIMKIIILVIISDNINDNLIHQLELKQAIHLAKRSSASVDIFESAEPDIKVGR